MLFYEYSNPECLLNRYSGLHCLVFKDQFVTTNDFQNHSLSGDSYYVNKPSLLCQQLFTCLQHVLYWKFALANCKLVLHNSLFMFYAPPFSSDIISAVSRNYILTRIFNCCQPVFLYSSYRNSIPYIDLPII